MSSATAVSAEIVGSEPGLCARWNVMRRVKSTVTALRSALFVVLAFALAGCASQSYLYNAEKDKQGQVAKKAASEAKLGDAIVAAEQRNGRLLDLELEAAKTRYAQIRELEIREVAFSPKPLGSTWLARIDGRLLAIYGTSDFQDVVAAQKALAVENKKLQDHRDALEDLARPAPDCSVAEKEVQMPEWFKQRVPADSLSSAENLYPRLRQACASHKTARDKFDKALRQAGAASLLAVALKQLSDDENERAGVDAARKCAQAALAAAEKDFADATANLLPGATAYAETIAAAAKRLRERVESIEKAQEGIAIDVVAKARLDRIEDILSAVGGGEVDTSKWSPDLRQAVALAGTLPALVDEASRMLRDAARPRLVPFELAKQHQRLVVGEAEMISAVLDNRVQASTRIVEAYAAEASTLVLVRQTVEKFRSETLDKLNASPDTARKRELYEALGVYFDDVARYQRDQRLWEYRRLGTKHDEVIVHSKYAALMWQNLNDGIAATLAGYHGSGVKPETIAEFLKAFGLVFIGVGVN
ncbi:MAG TPA: hypothetical protein VGQ19_18375 [Burkholderiales bacterium]|jgi:hypothetical protein|nr:hypothetical protein [Burkholderiales bacterium]